MNVESAARCVATALLSAAATALFAWLAPRLGWTDVPRPKDAARKRQGRPVPAVGGAAILLALVVVAGTPWDPAGSELWGRWLPAPAWCLASLSLLFAAGTWDDRAGLAPGRKLLAQLVALAPLVTGAWLEHGGTGALALLGVGLATSNLLNTYDNADGALASLCALGFAPVAPLASAACLGFLPLNLDAGSARNRPSGAPTAYLGDAGAFVLGCLVVLAPRSAGILVLPALDLARLSLVRWRAGSRPWIGDRRHLAHRLEARGLPRPLVAAVLCALAWPASALVSRGLGEGDSRAVIAGILASTALYGLVLRVVPAGPDSAVPCPSRHGSE